MLKTSELCERLGVDSLITIAGYVGFCEGNHTLVIEDELEFEGLVNLVANELLQAIDAEECDDDWVFISNSVLEHGKSNNERAISYASEMCKTDM